MEKQQQDEKEMLMRLVKLNNNFAKMKEQKELNKKIKIITMTITMKTIIFLVKINNFTSLLLWKLLLITKKFFV